MNKHEFLDIEYTSNGDFMTVKLEEGKSTRRKIIWKQHRSPEPKVCEFSGKTVSKGETLGTLHLKRRGLKTIYFHPEFQVQEDNTVDKSNPLESLDSLLELLDMYVEDKQNKVISKEKSLRKEMTSIKQKKDLVGSMRSKINTLITTIRTLEEV